MREGWEYKKLGEICLDFIVPQRDKPTSFDGDIPWCRIEDIEGKYLNGSLSGQMVSKELADRMNMHICPKGTVICACSASIGNQAIATVDCYTNQTFIGIVPNSSVLYNEFLFFFFKARKKELIQMGTGATIKYISKKKFQGMRISIPPLSEQERIVSELDLLQSIIEKKKSQLKEYDQLAQSIFFDMFGDPVTNEKGWEVKKLGEICNSELGKTLNKTKDTGTLRPYLCAINIQWNKIVKENLKQTRFEDFELERYTVKKGDLLICEGGDIGRAAIWNEDEEIQYQNALHRLRFGREMLPIFCLNVLKFLKDKGVLDNRYGKGVTIKHLVKSTLLSIPFIVPPFSLQQQFAAKIESIEKQKELIKQSITEVQTLFDSRMDYYFN